MRLVVDELYACDLGVKHLFIGDSDWKSYFENCVYLRLCAADRKHTIASVRDLKIPEELR